MISYGSDARFVEFPKMITTEWEVGSVQEVAWSVGSGGHKGGYTFRFELLLLCVLASSQVLPNQALQAGP